MTTLTVTCSCGARLEVNAPEMSSEVWASYRYDTFLVAHAECRQQIAVAGPPSVTAQESRPIGPSAIEITEGDPTERPIVTAADVLFGPM